jgi:hypothetical protein
MSQQYNKTIKKKRRLARIRRKRAATRSKQKS